MAKFLKSLRVGQLLKNYSKNTILSPQFRNILSRVQSQHLVVHERFVNLRHCSSVAVAEDDKRIDFSSILSEANSKAITKGLQLDDIQSLLDFVKKKDNLSSEEALQLTRVCGIFIYNHRQRTPPDIRQKTAKQVWKLIKSFGIHPEESHYNALLQPHVQPTKLVIVEEFGKELSSKTNEYVIKKSFSKKYV